MDVQLFLHSIKHDVEDGAGRLREDDLGRTFSICSNRRECFVFQTTLFRCWGSDELRSSLFFESRAPVWCADSRTTTSFGLYQLF